MIPARRTRVALRSARAIAAVSAAVALGACAGPEGGVGENGGPASPPVLVLSIDTLRQDFLGTTGDPDSPTPELDRLARRSALFPAAQATSSWTLPSHVSLLTGLYPSRHGLTGDGRSLPDEERTLAEALHDARYRTAGFVSGPYLHRAYGYAQGFDVWEHCMDYDIETDERGRIANPILANQRSHRGVTSPTLESRATAWLDGVPVGTPWLLFVHWWDPHYDFEPPFPWDRWLDPAWRGRFRADGFLTNRRIAPDWPDDVRDRVLDLYRGEIRWTDAWIGALLDAIEERGELDRAVVVVVGDHGEEFFEHGGKGHRRNLHAETLRIPLLARVPDRLDGGRIVGAPASLVDVAPTVRAATGLPPSADDAGVDLVALGTGRGARPGVAAELHARLAALVTARWKLVLDRETGEESLYDVGEDPGETTDLRAGASSLADSLARLLDEVDPAPVAGLDRPDAPIDAATAERLRALGYTE